MKSSLGRAEAALAPELRQRSPGSRPILAVRAILALAWTTWTEIRRGASPWIFVAIGVAAAVTASLLPTIGTAARAELLLEIVYGIVLILSMVVVVFATASLTPRDLEERTVFTVLAKPVSRGAYAFGRGLGLMLASVASGFLAVLTAILALQLLDGSSFNETPQEHPTRLIKGEGPTPEGRLVFLSGFPTELMWLSPERSNGHDSLIRFRFDGDDFIRCADSSGWIRVELTGINTSMTPMSEIVTIDLTLQIQDDPSATTSLQAILRERTARIDIADLPPDFVDSLEGDETVVLEVRTSTPRNFIEAERGSAQLALPQSSSLTLNFILAGFGIMMTLSVLSWITFAFSILLSTKVTILIGLGTAAVGHARENLSSLLRMAGGNPGKWGDRELIDPQRVLEDFSATKTNSDPIDSFAQSAIEGLAALIPDLTRFDFTTPLLQGYCVSGGEILSAASSAATWIFICSLVSIAFFALRRLR